MANGSGPQVLRAASASATTGPGGPLTEFDKAILEDFNAIVVGEFSETIRYKAGGDDICLDPWKVIPAIIEDRREEIGIENQTRTGPLFITVSQRDVASVQERIDAIEYRGTEYTVQLVDTVDRSGWRLYCVR